MASKSNVDYIDMVRQDTAPAKPAARSRRQERVYLDGDGEMQRKSDDGTITAVGGSSGGTVPILTGSGAPSDGVTGAGVASPGWTYIDIGAGAQYLQIGTLESPVWGLLGAYGVRVKNAATDGVLVDEVMTGTSQWTVPLDSGPAASRDHMAVLLSLPPITLAEDTSYYVHVGNALIPGTGDGVNNAGVGNSATVSVDRYRDTQYGIRGTVYDEAGNEQVAGGSVFTDGPLSDLVVELLGLPSGAPVVPPVGGHIEFWLG